MTHNRPVGEPAELRASDADREQAVERLREAFADGRITVDELTGRLDRVYAATSRAQVGATVTDLPAAASPERFRRRRRPLLPGVSSFVERLDVPRAIDVVGEHVVTDIAPPLAKRGYEFVRHDGNQIVFVREWRPAWTIVVAILVFPIGLIALLHKQRDQITIMLRPHDSGTRLIISGAAPVAVRRAFASLTDADE